MFSFQKKKITRHAKRLKQKKVQLKRQKRQSKYQTRLGYSRNFGIIRKGI